MTVETAYRRFLNLNEPFKAVCTAWQLRRSEPLGLNDHSDADYDRAVIGRLTAVHRKVIVIVDDLAALDPRFVAYPPRLEGAHARVLAGDLDAFTRPMTGSYHDVWMELHQDLLVLLGIERHEGVS